MHNTCLFILLIILTWLKCTCSLIWLLAFFPKKSKIEDKLHNTFTQLSNIMWDLWPLNGTQHVYLKITLPKTKSAYLYLEEKGITSLYFGVLVTRQIGGWLIPPNILCPGIVLRRNKHPFISPCDQHPFNATSQSINKGSFLFHHCANDDCFKTSN